MRYLKPDDLKIKANDKTYNIRFTLDVIDEIQDRTGMSMNEVMMLLSSRSKKHKREATKTLLEFLIKENIEFKDDELDYYSFELIRTYINNLKFKDMPKPKKDDVYNEGDIPFIDVEYWFYIGKVVLGFPADEVWQMTIGQIKTLEREHAKYNGWIKEDKVVNIDDVLPL